MLKRIWSDPVWSSVIAAVVIEGIRFAFTVLTHASAVITIVLDVVAALAIVFAASLMLMRLIQNLREPIRWDFSAFLGMSAFGGKDIHVSSFQARGHNKVKRHFHRVNGYIESNINGERVPLLLESMPPEQTNGIPPDCNFWVRALFRDASALREGIEAEKFLQRFSDFTFVIDLDGKKHHKRFPSKVVRKQILLFWQASNPAPASAVTKKRNEL